MAGFRASNEKHAAALRWLSADSDAAPQTLSASKAEEYQEAATMEWLRRVLRSETHESHVGIALILCLLVMRAMSIALVWQAQIIANRRNA